MIDCKQLRVGNKFECMGMIQTVKSIIDHTDRGDYTGGEPINGYEYLILVKENKNQYKPIEIRPIPLSPEVLQKCGGKFKRSGIGGADMWQGMDFWAIGDIVFRGNVSTSKGGTLSLAGYFNSRIQYLHQLQNLFFALTGTELTYNPNQP